MDADEFWAKREEELGTPILSYTLGRVIRENSKIPLWGLFYTTQGAVYFQTFESENWLSMIFSAGGGKSLKRSQDEIIEIPVQSIQTFAVHEHKRRLLFRRPPLVELRWKSAENGEEGMMLFEMEGDAAAFVATLPR